jgi:hypothetical protein
MNNDPRRIEIQIDELFLQGVAPADQRAVSDALQQELEALVTRDGVEALLSRPETFTQQGTPPISLPRGARPEQLGAQIARALHRSWR